MPVPRSKIPKLVIVGLAGVAVLALTWLAVNRLRQWQDARTAEAHVREIVALLGLEAEPEFHRRLGQVRSFINDHSERRLDEEFYANRRSSAVFAAGVLAHAKGRRSDPINMECSTRTRLMRAVLTALGYRTRDVAIFDSHRNLKSHSFLEVLNPKTGRWETQDADFDIYWRDKQTGEHISLAERAEAIDSIEPCGRDVCGWDHASREDLKPDMLKTFLAIVSITDREDGLRYAVYTSRADRGRVYRKDGETGSFCEVEAKRCEDGFHDIRTYRPEAR